MKQVTKNEFYDIIGPKDAVVHVNDNYIAIFKDRKNGYKVLGKVTNKPKEYFLNK